MHASLRRIAASLLPSLDQIEDTLAAAAIVAHPSPARVDFLAALRSGRPLRRRAWVAHGPVRGEAEDLAAALDRHYWIYPRILMRKNGPGDDLISESIFVQLFDGRPRTLMLPDFLADDWESMP